MNFSSLSYYLFLPMAVFLYFITKPKYRNVVLLILSYFFYMCWNVKYSLLMLSSTIITYLCGLLMDSKYLGKKRLWLGLSFIINLAILFFFKYFNFFAELTSSLTGILGMPLNSPVIHVMLPVGISFYTFQALGYTMDVYRGDLKAEKNFIDYAVFVSFFPQLVAGPIERSTNLIHQVKRVNRFQLANIRDGMIPLLGGLFKKIVIADRLAVAANTVYNDTLGTFNGVHYIIGTLCFAFQIYCDFSAYSDIARGSAKFLGIDLMINFKAPYFAQSIKDFWRRWHISLSSWFKDYLYFPLGGSRCSKLRSCLNLMVVFTVSGLWHGAAMTFVLWGMLNGLYQVMGILLNPVKEKLYQVTGISKEFAPIQLFRWVFTFMLVCFSWIFFRAASISEAFYVIRKIFTANLTMALHTDYTIMGLSKGYIIVSMISVFLLMGIDYIGQYKNIEKFVAQRLVLKYAVYFVLIVSILIFGYYGMGYDAQDFIYFQF